MKNTPKSNISDWIQSANQHFKTHNWQAAAKEYDKIGMYYQRGANPDYEKALDFFQKALKCKRKITTQETPDIADSYYSIASNYSIKGQYKQALPLFQQSLHIYKQYFGEQAEKVAEVYMSLAILYRSTAAYTLALKYLEQALQIMTQLKGEDYSELYGHYFILGTIHYMMGTYDQALKWMLKAQSFFEQYDIDDMPYLANIHSLIGALYEVKGEYDLGIQHNEKALYYLSKSVAENHPQFGFYYHNMAATYLSKGNLKTAMDYLQKALKIMSDSLGEMHYEVGTCTNTIGVCHLEMGNFEEARQSFQKSLKNRQHNYGKSHDHTASNYYNIGRVLQTEGKYLQALQYFQTAQDIHLQVLPITHPEVIGSYNRMARCYSSLNDFPKALEYLQKNLTAVTGKSPNSIYETSTNFSKQAETLQISLEILETKAETLFLQCQSKASTEAISLIASLAHYQICSQIINQLRQQYKATDSKLTLSQRAFHLYKKAIEVALVVAKYAENEPIYFKDTLQKLAAINPDKELQDFLQSLQNEQTCEKLAFRFVENCKGILLLEGFQGIEAKATAQIPLELLQKEKRLQAEITYLEKRISSLQSEMQQEENKAELQPILRDLQSRAFDIRQIYLQLVEKLEGDYPDYFQLKYDSQTIEVADLQSSLSESQVLVNYFVGEKKYYLFVATIDEFEVRVLEKPNDFEVTIQQFLQAIEEHHQGNFIKKGHQLYQWLIQPIADFLFDPLGFEDELKQLVIVSHAELNYLPFEALLCSEPLPKLVPASQKSTVGKVCSESSEVYSHLDYLIRHCEISYQYSATLWYYLQNRKDQNTPIVQGKDKNHENDFVGFAPVYTTRNKAQKQLAENYASWVTRSEALRSDGTWVSLPYSKVEAENIAALFEAEGMNTQIFLHDSANKANFVEAVGKSRFVLIASHGIVNDQQPKLSGLVFYPDFEKREVRSGKQDVINEPLRANHQSLITNHQHDCILSMEETYQLQLQADLVVLSSCESGIGELTKGEGMMAINRGFLYAGAKNVVFTLFKVLDKASSELTQNLFESILKGESYTAALRKAKLQLIQREGIDPKSWSGFVLIGN